MKEGIEIFGLLLSWHCIPDKIHMKETTQSLSRRKYKKKKKKANETRKQEPLSIVITQKYNTTR